MKPELYRWRKFFYAAPVMIVTQSLVALLIILFIYRPHHINWVNTAVLSLFYGVMITISAKVYNEKYLQSLGLSHVGQLWALPGIVKRVEIPKDKELKIALPAYLERRIKLLDKQKNYLPYNTIVFGFMFLISISIHMWLYLVIFGFFLGLGFYLGYSYKKTRDKITDLQIKLGIQPSLSDDEIEKDDNGWKQNTTRVKSSGIILGIVILISVIFIIVSSAHTKSSNITGDQIAANALKNSSSSQQPSVFTFSKYDFKIKLPNKPSATQYYYQPNCNEDTFPYTMYSSSNYNGTQVYTMYVMSWPEQDADFSDMSQSALKPALISFINSDLTGNNATLKTITDEHTFSNGTLAEEAQFTESENGQKVNGYDRVFTIGNFEYDLFAQVSDKSTFDSFANSFQFTGPSDTNMPNDWSNKVDSTCLNLNSNTSSAGDTINSPPDQTSSGTGTGEIPGNATLNLQ